MLRLFRNNCHNDVLLFNSKRLFNQFENRYIVLMRLALNFHYPKNPDSWDDLPSGHLIREHINQTLSVWCPKFFGYHLLKIGNLSAQLNTEKSLIKSHIEIRSLSSIRQSHDSNQGVNHGVNPSFNERINKHEIKTDNIKDNIHSANANVSSSKTSQVIANIDDLPFIQHSVDVCLLSHALEFTSDPHHVIREANRVLIPNGYMVVTGYNPMSLAGLNKILPYRNKQSPWNMKFFLPSRIKDWLVLMGYEVLADERMLFNVLNREPKQKQVTQKWEQLAKQYLTCFGSVYVIVAKKRRLPLTPIKPKWQLKTSFKPVGVSTMNSSIESKKEMTINPVKIMIDKSE